MPSTMNVTVGAFPPQTVGTTTESASASFSDLVGKAQSILQGFQLFGYTIDWVAAGKVVIAAALTPGATLLTVLEAIAMNAGTIFVHTGAPSPEQLRAVFSMLAPAS